MKVCLKISALICLICTFTSNSIKNNLVLPTFKVGDIILREGSDLDSLLIKRIIKDKYTHAGLIISTNPIKILHATTNDNMNKQNQVIISSFDEYILHAKSVVVQRLNIGENIRENIALDSNHWIGKAFVLESKDKLKNTSLHDSKALYCTTLIESILSKYTNFSFNYAFIDFPLFSGYYLLPKAFLANTESIYSLEITK